MLNQISLIGDNYSPSVMELELVNNHFLLRGSHNNPEDFHYYLQVFLTNTEGFTLEFLWKSSPQMYRDLRYN